MQLFYKKMEAAEDDGAAGGASEQEEQSIDWAARAAELEKEREALKRKNEELLGETKAAKAARREAEEAARREAEEKAKKNGDFEQLFKSAEDKASKYEQELNTLRENIANEKRTNTALSLAGELAEGANAKLLSEFIARRLKVDDEGVKVIDASGNLTVATLDDLKKEFSTDATYSSLLKGNQSAGGGATGSQTGSGAAKEMARADFDKLSAPDRMKFIKGGGKVLNE